MGEEEEVSHTHKTHNWGIKWTEDEDQRLLRGIELYGENDWKKIGELVGTREPGQSFEV